MNNEKLKSYVYEVIQKPTNDVFPIEFEGKRLWVKKAKVCGSNFLHHTAYKIFKNPLLIPSKKQKPLECIFNESSRIKEIFERFSHVPEVVFVCDDFMVISDSGVDLRTFLNFKNHISQKQEIEKVVYDALDVLIDLHKIGFFHGGSQIKNMTIKDEKIYLIDFEEKFIDAKLEDLQFRDLFLFLISVSKLNYEIDYKKIIDTYKEKTSATNIDEKFKELTKSTKFLMKILDNEPIRMKMDKDTQSVYRLFKTFS